MKSPNWKAILWLAALSCTAHAQSRAPAGGNPVAALPQINIPQKTPKVTLQIQQSSRPMQQLLARRLTPTKIQVEGVKALPFAEVAQRFKPLVGKSVSLAELIAVADGITKLYQQRGYALSFCFVPAQTFAGGVVRITVVEGYVAHVKITGKPGATERRIREIVAHIRQDRPLRKTTFERYVNVLGLLPGVRIAATVPVPKNTDGATTLTLNVQRKAFTVTGGLETNQPGVQGLITVTENGLTPLGEQLSVSTLEPKGRDNQTYYVARAAVPLGSSGLVSRIEALHYRGQPTDNPGLPGYITRTVVQDKIGLSLAYPFLLSNARSLLGTVSAYASHDEDAYGNVYSGGQIGLRSQVRVIQTQLDYNTVKTGQVRKASFTLAKALNVLGASKSGDSNLPGVVELNPVSLDFVRLDTSFLQTNDWGHQFGTVVAFTGQYSPESLPTSEEISFGGQRFGLGYEPGETAGDSGWGVSVEINRTFALDLKYLKSVVPYVSFALARVYLHAGSLQPDRLASVALGVRVTDKKYFTLDLSLGKPVGDAPIESASRSPRINASFSYQLN